MSREESFTKLASSITDSSVWAEDHATRIVWITLLAMVDQHGYVGASVLGLANRARVTLAECEAALAKFRSPDPYSRTTEYEGRRIVDAERGWLLLNYRAFRERRSAEDKREADRLRMAEKRAGLRCRVESQPVASSRVESRQVAEVAQAEAEEDQEEELNKYAGASPAERLALSLLAEETSVPTATRSLRPVRAADASARPANDQDGPILEPGEPEPSRPTHELVRLCFSARFVKLRGNPPVWGPKQVAHMHTIASWVEGLNGDDEKLLARLLDGFFRDSWAAGQGFPIGALASNPPKYFSPPAGEPPRGPGRRVPVAPATTGADFEGAEDFEAQLARIGDKS
jgi:hypothetical protein